MVNPYQAPLDDSELTEEALPFERRRGSWAIAHVRWVAIAMAVVGIGELVVAALGFLVVIGFGVAFAIEGEKVSREFGESGLIYVILGSYLMVGLVHGVTGGLRLYAAIQNYRFRARRLGFVSMGVGLLTALTACCLPTALILAVYGMVVYLDEGVRDAFILGERGYSRERILAIFADEPEAESKT